MTYLLGPMALRALAEKREREEALRKLVPYRTEGLRSILQLALPKEPEAV